jgi:hypothetical protein
MKCVIAAAGGREGREWSGFVHFSVASHSLTSSSSSLSRSKARTDSRIFSLLPGLHASYAQAPRTAKTQPPRQARANHTLDFDNNPHNSRLHNRSVHDYASLDQALLRANWHFLAV